MVQDLRKIGKINLDLYIYIYIYIYISILYITGGITRVMPPHCPVNAT